MTNDELEAVRARVLAATAGPWEADITGEIYAPDQSSVCMALMSDVGLNAAFIAHARTDIPALLDALTRAEAHAERLASVIVRGLAMEQLPPYARDMEGRRTTLRKEARQALSAYRGSEV